MSARYTFTGTDKKINLVAKFEQSVSKNDIVVEMDKTSIKVMRKGASQPVIEVRLQTCFLVLITD